MKYLDSTKTRMAAAALAVVVAFSHPIAAHARGGGFHDGGGFHGGDFHSAGSFHSESTVRDPGAVFGRNHFNIDHFDHGRDHGFGGWWWDSVPYYGDNDTFGSDLGTTHSSQYWYCQNPAGYYPYVTSCTTTWQPVPAG